MSQIPFPTKAAILSAYRQILRNSNPKLQGRRARKVTLDSPFVDQVRVEFRQGATIQDPMAAWKAHSIGADCAAMLTTNITHAEALFAGGWCLNKPNAEAVKSVASFVGFDMPITYDESQSRVEQVLGATPALEDIDIFGGSNVKGMPTTGQDR